MQEKFLRYSINRDVVLVFGAGASHSDGVPLQREMLPTILSGGINEIENSTIGILVTEFIKDNFEFNKSTNQYPQLEAVFGFIDYFLQQNESLNSKYTVDKIRDIKEYLIKLIHFVVNLQTNKHSRYYHTFWEAVTKFCTNISIITLNYDTLLEQAFDFLFKHHGYIDYCIHLMNYDRIPSLKNYNFWINPREPVEVLNHDKPTLYKILKLHGSLNWKYCTCCNQTLLTPWDRTIDLNKGKFLGYTYPDKEEYEFICPIDGTEFQTLILPPTYNKTIHHPIISQLFVEASKEIRATRKIVFIGYSMSGSDVHIKALFKKHINSEIEVIVINPKRQESLELNYRSLTSKVRFQYMSFEELIENEKNIEKIFS